MAYNGTYIVLVKYNLLKMYKLCKLSIGRESFTLTEDLALAKSYRYRDMENVGLFQEHGIIYLKNGSSFVFKSRSSDFMETKKMLNEIKKKVDKENKELTNSSVKTYKICLTNGLKENLELRINRDCFEIIKDGRQKKRYPYSTVRNVKMHSEFGCITMINHERIKFVSRGPGKFKVDRLTLSYTRMIIDAVKRARSSHMEYLLMKPTDHETQKDPDIVKTVERKAKNPDYWGFYEESALRDGEEKLEPVNDTGLSTAVKYIFQNAVSFNLLGKYQKSEALFAEMKDYYGRITEQSYGSTDFFRLFVADYLYETFDDMSRLFQSIKTLQERNYMDDIDEKNTGISFVKPGDKNMKMIYRLIDLLQLCRIGFIAGEYTEAAAAVKKGREIIDSFKSEGTFYKQLPESSELHNISFSENLKGLGARIDLYDRMFSILSGLIRNVTLTRRPDRKVLLEELPRFFDEYINPHKKKISYFGIEEEVQWALIYYLSCRRILGLFYDLSHHIALRKFLG